MAAIVLFGQRCNRLRRLGAAAAVTVLGLVFLASPVLAQSDGFMRRGNSIFESLFGPFSTPRRPPPERQIDFTRAPPPRKLETRPTSVVLLLGDSMADWLGYGLEEALADRPEMGVVRRHRAGSGLIRYDPRNEALDWAHVAQEAIAATKPQFVVMMLGLNDRQTIRARPLPAGASTGPGATAAPPLANAAQPGIMAPEQQSQAHGKLQTFEFRTEQWAEHYSRMVDATIAAMKSAGVPVFWVGLPSVRGTKSTGDMLYLNDLYRTRAEKAGITYIDVWDGFVDENGRFVVHGPDFEGQTRRLRVSDGVHFTKAGARKLAHYVEREILRVMTRGVTPVSLPTSEPQVQMPVAQPGMPTPRPLSGPVLPLTATATGTDDLVGGAVENDPARQPIANRALVKGEALTPPAGRSDDFKWPRRGIASFGTDPVVATTTDPIPVMHAAPATTVPVPKGESRTVTTDNAKRATGREPSQRRRNPARSSAVPFFR